MKSHPPDQSIDQRGGRGIGQWLRSKRLDSNLTQKELADLLGITISHISKIERGQLEPTYSLMIKIASKTGGKVILK